MKNTSVAGVKPLAGMGAIAAAVALFAAFLMLAPSATAAEPDPVTIDGCTITVPAVQGIIYYANDEEIDPGTYDAVDFYSGATFRAELPGEVVEEFGPWEIDVPVECLVDVTAACDDTVTFTKAGAFDWGTLSVEWSREDGADHGTHNFSDGESVSATLTGFPLYYEITEAEMGKTASGTVEAPDCEQPAEPAPQDPPAATPSKAPASGL